MDTTATATASSGSPSSPPEPPTFAQELAGIRRLLWGDHISADIFDRWSQGFVFSRAEPSALVQQQGGPCAVIAPVQAILLQLLLGESGIGSRPAMWGGGSGTSSPVQGPVEAAAGPMSAARLSALQPDKCRRLLVQALCTILDKAQTRNGSSSEGGGGVVRDHPYRVVVMAAADGGREAVGGGEADAAQEADERMAEAERPAEGAAAAEAAGASCEAARPTAQAEPSEEQVAEPESFAAAAALPAPALVVSAPAAAAAAASEAADTATSQPPAATDWAVPVNQPNQSCSDDFHRRLCLRQLDTLDEVHDHYMQQSEQLQQRYGVLLFTYSVMLTKRLAMVEAELAGDLAESLIHNEYGYASQALINLMLTGRAVANVWDNDQEIGGMQLKGIDQQADIGFITLMEQMRYITVGSFYKNPKSPVWIMGSETHLSVLFSDERRLVSPETAGEVARRAFRSFDPEGNNFIPTSSLQPLLADLKLVSEPEYVELMAKRLDPEGLGIILMNTFLDEFFSGCDRPAEPDTFGLLHYNGIPGSNDNQRVKYNRGCAVLLECDIKQMCSPNNPMLTCLQTKWPNIEVNWTMDGNHLWPSLN